MPHLGKQIYRQTQHRLLNFCCLLSTDADDQRRQESISRKNSTTLQGAAEREPFDQSGGWGEFPQQAAGEISGDGNLPCSSSLYKRRHCLPSVTSQTRLLLFNKCLWLYKQKIKSHHSSARSAINLTSLTARAS